MLNIQELELNLNSIPAKFSSTEVQGELLSFINKDQLKNLQNKQIGTWVCKRAGSQIQAVPLSDKSNTLNGVKVKFSTKQDSQLFQRLLEEGVRRLLRSSYPNFNVTEFGKVILKITGSKNDILSQALHGRPDILQKLSFLKIYRCYEFDAVHVQADFPSEPEFGIRTKLSTSWEFGVSARELSDMGMNLEGFYVLPFSMIEKRQIGYKVAGSIREIKEGKIFLDDARDVKSVNANDFTVEGSLENVSLILRKLFGEADSLYVHRMIRGTVSTFLGAKEQQGRIEKIAAQTFQTPIHCAYNLSSTVIPTLQRTSQASSFKRLVIDPPSYLLRFGSTPIKGL